MFYYLHLLSEYGEGLNSGLLKGFNVFQYITFRAVAAGVTAFVLSLVCGNWVIRHLISLKLGQPIRSQEEVHRLHELHGSKAGTPTMGGVLLLGSLVVAVLLWARPTNPKWPSGGERTGSEYRAPRVSPRFSPTADGGR